MTAFDVRSLRATLTAGLGKDGDVVGPSGGPDVTSVCCHGVQCFDVKACKLSAAISELLWRPVERLSDPML